MKRNFKIAIVGTTGLVGRTFIKVLEERNFPVSDITFFASRNSAGKEIKFNGQNFIIEELKEETIEKYDFALFSAGGTISKQYAPIFAQKGTIVIDNSSAWRMDKNVPLVVPEVNPEDLSWHNNIIANPNCSTIQLIVALKPISDNFGLNKVIVSTYQSISGAGQKGLDKYHKEMLGQDVGDKHKIFSNAFFHPVSAEQQDWTIEEIKMINETRKMLHNPNLPISVTCVRLPFEVGHSETVYIETEKDFQKSDLIEKLNTQENLIIIDDLYKDDYPTPAMTKDKDEVFVGRIRKDLSINNAFWMWVVANNIRKGAATNAIQIAEKMIEMNLVN
jgi:aspartate-semialdehyde dehydrogenase